MWYTTMNELHLNFTHKLQYPSHNQLPKLPQKSVQYLWPFNNIWRLVISITFTPTRILCSNPVRDELRKSSFHHLGLVRVVIVDPLGFVLLQGSCTLQALTPLPLDKMAAILADDIFNCIFLNGKFEFWLKFHWSLFLRVQLTISKHWFR